MAGHRSSRTAPAGKDSNPDLAVVLAIHRRATGFYTDPRLQARVLPARSEIVTTLIPQMSDLLAPISKSTTRA